MKKRLKTGCFGLLLLAGLVLLFLGCTNPVSSPTVTSVTVTPSTANVARGEKQQFNAVVNGSNNPAQTVTWSVNAPHAEETVISSDGLLTVALNETAVILTVMAVSTGNTSKFDTAVVTIIGDAPGPLTGSVIITGTAQAGRILTADIDDLDGSGTVSYQWKRGDSAAAAGTNIPGAVAQTYTPSADDVGKYLKVSVTRTGYTGSVTSAATSAVLAANAAAPTVTGVTVTPATISVVKGGTQTFTAAVTGENNPAQTVIWSVDTPHTNGTAITTAGILTVAAGETATTLTVRAVSTVDTTKSGTAAVTVSSTASVTVNAVTVTPATATVAKGGNQTFTAAVTGNGSPAQTVTWSVDTPHANGTTITTAGVLTVAAGETATTLTVRAASTVDTTKSGTATVTVTGDTSSPLTGSVSITGTAQAGQVLTANIANLGGSGTVSYQWTRGDSAEAAGTAISGAVAQTYTPSANDVGKYLKVTVTRTGYTGSVTSAVTSAVLAADTTIPTVTSVTVTPANPSVVKGGTQQFSATVIGTNNPAQTVTWSVTGGGAGTSITSTAGLLTVAVGETAATLTVTATSTVDATKSGAASVTVTEPPPTVTNVTVTPATANVLRGETQQFSATVTGTHNPAQTVTWNVTGGGAGTSITTAGLLTVAADETAVTLTVRATSTVDATKSGTASVTVPVPTVTSVTVSPATATVLKGETQQFSAAVVGTNNPAQTVTWSVTGGVAGTSITAGLLTVADGETASSLTVRATSTLDATKSGTATVTVPHVTSVTVSPVYITIIKGGTQQFTAEVTGTNDPPQTVTWTVIGGGTGTSISSDGVLTVASNENASSLIIRARSTYETSRLGTTTIWVTGTAEVYTNIVRTAFETNNNLHLDFNSTVNQENSLWARVDYDNYFNQEITYTWYINGVLQEDTDSEVNLPVGGLSPGIYYGLAIVTIDGTAFSRSFAFRVVE